jgi:hypothetical protein
MINELEMRLKMHPKQVSAIATKIVEISKLIKSIGDEFEGLYMHDEVVYSLPVEHHSAFNDIARQLLNDKNRTEKFSEEYVTKKIKTIFASLLKNEEINVEDQISKFVAELDGYETKQTVLVPVIGIRLHEDLKVGSVTFLMPSAERIETIKKSLQEVINKYNKTEVKQKEVFDMFYSEMEEQLFKFTISEFSVIAEPDRAYERAKEETRRALEIIRFASKAHYPMSEDIRIGLKGEPGFGARRSFIISDRNLNSKGDNEGALRHLEMSKEVMRSMDKLGFSKLSGILAKPSPTNYEEVLLRAVHWFSSALQQQELENAFLCLIIALETIFTAERGNPITNTVAEGVALVLGHDFQSRKDIKKTIKDHYGMRSGVSHGGKKAILDSDYYTLMNMVGSIIAKLTDKTNTFSSQKEFSEWIEELKLS